MTLKTKLLAASALFMLSFFIGIFHNGSRCSFGEQNRVISKYNKVLPYSKLLNITV